MNLYGRLFKYRQRETRSPLEDFLSEALADLLGRVPPPVGRVIVATMLGGGAEVCDATKALWPDDAKAEWITQQPVAVGETMRYIDLTLRINDRAVLAIENKVAAGFRESQLSDYSGWISAQASPSWGGAMIVLTHTTPAPEDFSDGGPGYPTRHNAVIRWSALARLLGHVDKA